MLGYLNNSSVTLWVCHRAVNSNRHLHQARERSESILHPNDFATYEKELKDRAHPSFFNKLPPTLAGDLEEIS